MSPTRAITAFSIFPQGVQQLHAFMDRDHWAPILPIIRPALAAPVLTNREVLHSIVMIISTSPIRATTVCSISLPDKRRPRAFTDKGLRAPISPITRPALAAPVLINREALHLIAAAICTSLIGAIIACSIFLPGNLQLPASMGKAAALQMVQLIMEVSARAVSMHQPEWRWISTITFIYPTRGIIGCFTTHRGRQRRRASTARVVTLQTTQLTTMASARDP